MLFTDKKTLMVCAFKDEEQAKKYYPKYANLVKMTEKLVKNFNEEKPLYGAVWTLKGWTVDPELETKEKEEYEANREKIMVTSLEAELSIIRADALLGIVTEEQKKRASEIAAQLNELNKEG